MLYRILHPRCVIHYAATQETADLVSKDLIQRFGEETSITACEDTAFTIDFGGAILLSEKPIEYKIEGFTYGFWAHQHLDLLNKLNNYLMNPRDGKYIKIHGAWTTIAMPVSHAEALRKLIKADSPNLSKLESDFEDKFESAMQGLRERNFVVQVEKPKSKLDIN